MYLEVSQYFEVLLISVKLSVPVGWLVSQPVELWKTGLMGSEESWMGDTNSVFSFMSVNASH